MKACPTCGNQNEDAAAFCDNCGATLSGGGAPPPQMQPQYTPPPPQQQFTPPAPGGAGGVNCPQCGTPNLPGTMFCDNCGVALSGAPATPPQQAYPPPQQQFTPPQTPYTPTPPQQPYTPPMGGLPPMPCRLMVAGQQISVPAKAEAIVGRADLASAWTPDVDLTAYGGTPEAGVSRKHLRIIWQNAWMIADMNTTNGTYVRGQRLVANQPTPINNGEVIQLGKLQITFLA